jgi:hypothetical protein
MARLGPEPGTGNRVTRRFRPQQLDSYRPLKHQVNRPPYLSRATRADQLVQTVPASQHPALADH